MDPRPAAFALVALVVLVVAAAPVWPWSRHLGPRPMIVAALCLTLAALLTVWSL